MTNETFDRTEAEMLAAQIEALPEWARERVLGVVVGMEMAAATANDK